MLLPLLTFTAVGAAAAAAAVAAAAAAAVAAAAACHVMLPVVYAACLLFFSGLMRGATWRTSMQRASRWCLRCVLPLLSFGALCMLLLCMFCFQQGVC
jgi:hypothetical protein